MRQDIPGNDHALEKLRELLDSGKAIAFVGAGASAGLYPLWPELIRRLAEEPLNRGLRTEADRDYWLRIADRQPQQVVRGVKEALGEPVYGEFLRQTFRPKAGSDGNRFTAVHSALLHMRFRGYVTTNYDPGLLEARLAVRPEVGATGYATWKDADDVQGWQTGDIFDEQKCPILFAHGIYERTDTVVLGVGEYREAYRAGPYRRAFEALWAREHLVFVGFGFSDVWFDCIADEVITQTAAQAAGEPRHVAVVGLRHDEQYSPEMRQTFRDQYNAEVYFYDIAVDEDGDEDHSDLLPRLEQLASPAAEPPRAPTPSRRPAHAAESCPQCWVHETTNDDLYVEPTNALARLDRWADDPSVRIIAVTGMGGLGKTALIGHWLKEHGGDTRREYRGLFYWSFYADRDVRSFFEALIEFATEELQFPALDEDTRPVEAARDVLRAAPLLIVLDGLEVLQERPGTVAYGALLEPDLRDFLQSACRLDNDGIVVLTSRFPFPDLTPHLGLCLRTLDLDHLTAEEGAALLERSGVEGTDGDRRDVSDRLEGHPLALRVYAAALATQADGDSTRFAKAVFDQALPPEDDPSEGLLGRAVQRAKGWFWRALNVLFRRNEVRASPLPAPPLEAKLRRLLTFYEEQLPPERTTILGIVSLFRTPVPEDTIRTLAEGLSGAKEVLGELTGDSLRQELDALCGDHLLLRDRDPEEGDAYSCHPVLRDHFRSSLLASEDFVASTAADLLTEAPASDTPTQIREIEPVLTAIELLLEAGDLKRADELYRGPLSNGRLFLRLPAASAGLQCALGFVADERRRALCEQGLSTGRLSYYLNEVGLCARNSGELGHALPFYEQAAEIDRRSADKRSLSIQLHNYTELVTDVGQLPAAESMAHEALALAREVGDEEETCVSLCHLGHALALQGRVGEAMAAFEEANAIEPSPWGEGAELSSGAGTRWARLLARLGRVRRARGLTDANLRICEADYWFGDVARCHWILGLVSLAEGSLQAAREHLAEAESTMRGGQMLMELPWVLVTQADVRRHEAAWDDALRYAEEALALAAPRELRLQHADALVMRGRIVLDRARGEGERDSEEMRLRLFRAQDDAEGGLRIARECGYAWAERDAVELLADVHKGVGEEEKALSYRRDAQTLSRRLRLDPSD